MFCVKCGVQLKDDDRFCSHCGARTAVGRVEAPVRTLLLDKRNRKIAGVCAGFARYWEVDVTLIRAVWLALAITTGVGFLAYLAAWIVIPSDEHYVEERPLAPSPNAS